jgi:hypothetical protein
MSMIKVIQPHAQDFSEPVAALVKVSTRGIVGADKQALVKRAGAEFAEKISEIKFASDEVPVHLIAIGATEDYGPNRNGDGFTRDCCKKYHRTFEKFARFYRDHANKNPAKSYGVVKASYYNEPMRRIELICGLNGSKEAADRNGGLVADKELEKLAREQEIPVSMACKIPFDKCSACGNTACTRAEYCDSIENGGHCKAGGLKHNIGRVLDDGHVLHADNPDPSFFDISHVFRPADRIAYVSGQLQKAAGVPPCVSGAELAEQLGVTFPISLLSVAGTTKRAQKQLNTLQMLADAERVLEHQDLTKAAAYSPSGLAAAIQDPISLHDPVVSDERVKLAEVFRALADAGVILPVRDFLTLTIKQADDSLVTAVSGATLNIFDRLLGDPNIASTLENNVYFPADAAPAPVRLWAEKVAFTHSVLEDRVQKQAYRAALRGVEPRKLIEKTAMATASTNALAKHYALYKIAALTAVTEKYGNNLLTVGHCILQNYIT